MARDNHPAAARGVRGHGQIFRAQPRGVAGVPQDLGVFVGAHGADVEGAVRREHVLGAAGGVLGCAPGD